MDGFETWAAVGLKMRMWSSIQTRRSLLHFPHHLQTTEMIENVEKAHRFLHYGAATRTLWASDFVKQIISFINSL